MGLILKMRVPQGVPAHDHEAYRCFLPDLTGLGPFALQGLKAQRIFNISYVFNLFQKIAK